MPSSARYALLDIRDNILLAEEFTRGLTLEQFKADRRTFYAVSRCLEIVSEAARRLPEVVRTRHPDLPWRAIMGVGNVYRHEYDNVVEEIVWRTVTQSLAPLLKAVESELADSKPVPAMPTMSPQIRPRWPANSKNGISRPECPSVGSPCHQLDPGPAAPYPP